MILELIQRVSEKSLIKIFLQITLSIVLLFATITLTSAFSDKDLVVYSDSLNSAWQNWSWSSEIYFDSKDRVKEGSSSLYFSPEPWGGLYLNSTSPVNIKNFTHLSFNLFSFDSGSEFNLHFYNNSAIIKTINLSELGGSTKALNWISYKVPLSLVNSDSISGFAIQEKTGKTKPAYYFDNIVFGQSSAGDTPSANPTNPPAQNLTGFPAPTDTLQQNKVNIFDNIGLNSDWENWSWFSDVNLNYTEEGKKAIYFESKEPWAGLYLHAKSNKQIEQNAYLNLNAKTADTSLFQIFLVGADGKTLSPVLYLTESTDSAGWKNFTISLADFAGQNISGFIIQDKSNTIFNKLIINSISIGLNSAEPNNPILTPSPTTGQPQPSPSPVPSQSNPPVATGSFTVSNSSIYQNGQKIQLKGISWFGFETGTHAIHGLWTRNWKDMITQIKQSGFNAVRVPFCPPTLKGVQTESVDTSLNPELAGLNSLQLMDKILTEINNQGLFILMDHHNISCSTIEELWYSSNYSESDWVNDLKFVADRYKNLNNFIGIDIKNEPHGQATWGTNSATDWKLAAEKAGKAILQTNPNLLIFVQGVQNNPLCSSGEGHWMGGNLEPQHCYPISTAQIPADKLVLSPHVYGPDVYVQACFNDSSFPNNMPAIWEQHFGSLKNKGFTIVPGEWGGKYGSGDSRDKIWQDAIVSYFKSKNIGSSFYWSWNPNSGDTGGILMDDWKTINQDKKNLLNNYFNTCSY